ncbi:uncharacterized protein LOC113225997 isoform X2 [Hyposmocoma kahamanoa]|nr:uncharacterized protein LOC113225997 isoform X2 [Hyposmocoma kahamanoa]
MFSTSMLIGLVAVFAIPSILKVLVGSRRSSSLYTAYRRYLSTLLHTVSWFEHELKPNSISWKSLYAVRSRHLRASLASKLKDEGIVSQRDIALTQFGFIGFSVLKPDRFGIRQMQPGDWEAYNHFWKTIGFMIGLEDRYNICRNTIEETRQVCQLLLERVFTPCLENVPEYYEHMARVMLDGFWTVNPAVNEDAVLYFTRYLADVPGYIYTENDRITFQRKLKAQLKDKPESTGVDSTTLICKAEVKGLPERSPRLLYLHNYDSIESVPEYKQISWWSKYKLGLAFLVSHWYSFYLGRLYFNLNFLCSLIFMKYFPYVAFFRFGIKASLIDLFVESPADNTKPKVNAEYNKKNSRPWYISWLTILW